jgi:hypothetical protein
MGAFINQWYQADVTEKHDEGLNTNPQIPRISTKITTMVLMATTGTSNSAEIPLSATRCPYITLHPT